MNRCDSSTPRKLLAVVAVTASALTLGLLVVAPTYIAPGGSDAGVLASKMPDTPKFVVIEPSHIDVVGVRDRSVTVGNAPGPRDVQWVVRQPADTEVR